MRIIKHEQQFNNEKSSTGYSKMELRGYLHDDEYTRPAVIICPGGGYMTLTPHESDQTAMEFFGKGYDAFVCDYPLKKEAVYPIPQLAASYSIGYIRKHANEWNINKNNIAIGGFSAGAHVAACAGTLYDDEYIKKTLGDINDIRPDALILIYPCIGVDIPGYKDKDGNDAVLRCDKLVNADTPPAFIVTSFGDTFVSCNQSLNMARAMSDNDVPFELHCFEIGDHGALNADNMGYNEFTTRRVGNENWFQLCLDWLRDRFNENVGYGCNLSTEGRIKDDYFKLELVCYPGED